MQIQQAAKIITNFKHGIVPPHAQDLIDALQMAECLMEAAAIVEKHFTTEPSGIIPKEELR